MGDLRNPTPQDRTATRHLAARILQSIRDDEEMPLGSVTWRETIAGPELMLRSDVETLVSSLAQEVCALEEERDRMSRQEQYVVDQAKQRIAELTEALDTACANLEARTDTAQRRHVAALLRKIVTP